MISLLIFISALIPPMSIEEQLQTGINKLSSQETANLQGWIDRNYQRRESAFSGRKKDTTPVMEQNLNSGRVIKLSDNTYWEINPTDTPITQGWITAAEIQVKPDPSNQVYPYILTNGITGSSVRARKAGAPTSK